MGSSILTWNVPNFITVMLMVALGGVLFAYVTKALKTTTGS